MDQIYTVNVNDLFKEIKGFKERKATQITGTSVKILKKNSDISSAYICDFLNKTIGSGKFPAILQNGDITAVFRKGFRDLRKTIDQ